MKAIFMVLLALPACPLMAEDDLSRELRHKSEELGLALSQVRGSAVNIVPFDSDAFTCMWDESTDFASFQSDGRTIVITRGLNVKVMRFDGSLLRESRFSVSARQSSLSPDKRKLAFETRAGGLYVGDMDLGAAERIEPVSPGTMSWSPDNNQLVYSLHGEVIKRMIRPAGATTIAKGTNPTWSPNGERIAYLAEDGTARLTNPQGSNTNAIVSGVHVLGFLHWSPDSEYLMFGEKHVPGVSEFFTAPFGVSTRLSVYRLRDGRITTVHWFGPKGGDDILFGWTYAYRKICRVR